MIETAKSALDFVKKFALMEERITALENKLSEIEKRYQQGWTPENLCEKCHNGRYCHTSGTVFKCERCGHQATTLWFRKHYK